MDAVGEGSPAAPAAAGKIRRGCGGAPAAFEPVDATVPRLRGRLRVPAGLHGGAPAAAHFRAGAARAREDCHDQRAKPSFPPHGVIRLRGRDGWNERAAQRRRLSTVGRLEPGG